MGKFTTLGFILSQFKPAPAINGDLEGQTVVVIGANVGLGLAAAKQFASMNPGRLILACRSKERGSVAVEEVKRETGFQNVELKIVDLGLFASVTAFADQLEKENARIDVLVANAALGAFKYEATADGLESMTQVNHVSTALMCIRLLPLMVKTARDHNTTPRMTIVTSEMHFFATIDAELQAKPNILAHFSDKEYCTPQVVGDRYSVTKLLNVFFARALTAHLPPTSPVVVNSVNPGFCYSSLRRNMTGMIYLGSRIMEIFLARSEKVGGSTLVWAALAGTSVDPNPNLRDSQRGAYVSDWEVSEPSDFVLSKEGEQCERRLWDETIELLQQQDPKVRGIVEEYLTSR